MWIALTPSLLLLMHCVNACVCIYVCVYIYIYELFECLSEELM